MRNYLLILMLTLSTQLTVAASTAHSLTVYEQPKPSGFKTWWQDKKFKLKAFKVWYSQQRAAEGEPTEKQRKKSAWSLGLGIASIVFLFIPFVNLLSLPAAVLAIIFGAQSVKGNGNAKGIIGIVLGGVVALAVLIAILLLAVVLVAL